MLEDDRRTEKTYVVVGLVRAVEREREVVGLGGGCAERETSVLETSRNGDGKESSLMT